MNKDQIQKQINELTPFYQSNYVLNADWLRQSVSKPLVEPINVKLTKSTYTYSPLRYADTIYRYNKAREEQELDAKVNAENNSLADAFWSFNNILPSLLQGRPEDAQAYLNNIVHYGKNFVKPLLNVDENGNWNPYFGAWALQRFQALLEDLDVLANPVKGLLLEGFDGLSKQGAERVVGSDGKAIMTRKNYQYNTGNGWLDFALEVVSDPANWATLGTKALASGIAKGSAKAFMTEAGGTAIKAALRRHLGKEVSEEVIEKMAQKATTKVIKELSQQGLTKEKSIIKTVKKMINAKSLDDVTEDTVVRSFKKVFSNKYGLSADVVEDIGKVLKASDVVANPVLEKASASVLRGVYKAYAIGDALDTGVLKFAFAESGIYPTYKLLGKVPRGLEKFTARILGDSFEVVLRSPVSSGATAAETIENVVTVLNADTDLKAILDAVGKGEVTTKELSGVLLSKINKNLETLQEAVRQHLKGTDEVVDITRAVDEAVKKEFGYDTLAAFVSDIQTLKGRTDFLGQRAIYRLEKFQKDILKKDLQRIQKLGKKVHTQRLDSLKALEQDITSEPLEFVDTDAFLKAINEADIVDETLVVTLDTALTNGITAAQYKKLFDAMLLHEGFTDALTWDVEFVLKLQQHLVYAMRVLNPLEQLETLNPNSILSDTIAILKSIKAYVDLIPAFKNYLNPIDDLINPLLYNIGTLSPTQAIKQKGFITRTLSTLIDLEKNAPTVALKQMYTACLDNTLDLCSVNLPSEMFEGLLVEVRAVRNLKTAMESNLLDIDMSADVLYDLVTNTYKQHFNTLLTGTPEYDTALTAVLKRISDVFDTLRNGSELSVREIVSELNIAEDVSKAITDTTNLLATIKVKDFNVDKILQDMTNAGKVADIIRDVAQKVDNGINVIDGHNLKSIGFTKEKRKAVDSVVRFFERSIKEAPVIEAGSSADTFMVSELENAITTLKNFLDNPEKMVYDKFEEAYSICVKHLQTYRSNNMPKRISVRPLLNISDYEDVITIPGNLIQLKTTFKTIEKNAKRLAIDADYLKYTTQPQIVQDFFSGKAVSRTEFLTELERAIRAYNKESENLYEATQTTFLKTTDNIAKALTLFEPKRIMSEKITISANAVFYMLKGEQVFNVVNYLANEDLAKQILDLASEGSDVGRSLRNLISSDDTEVAQVAQNIIDLAENFRVYRDTYNSINELATAGIIDEQELTAIQSTLQKYALKDVNDIAVRFDGEDGWFKEFLKECSNYYNNAYKYTKSYAQDNIIKRNSKAFAEYDIKEYYHSPNTDAFVTLAASQIEPAIKKYLADPKNGCVGKIIKAFDIETTGLDKFIDDILSLGIADNLKQAYNADVGYKFITGYVSEAAAKAKMPQDDLLLKMFPDSKSVDDAARKYLEQYVVSNPGAKKQIYENFITELFKGSDNADDFVFLTHNGNAFDVEMLIHHFEKAGVDQALLNKFKNAKFIDNLEVLRAADGYIALGDDVAKCSALENVLRTHLDELVQTSASSNFFDMGIKPLRQQLDDLIGFIENTKLAPEAMQDTVKSIGTEDALTRVLKDLRNNIRDTGLRVKDLNAKLPLISKQAVKEQFSELLTIITKEFDVPSIKRFKKVYKALKAFQAGDDTHLTRALYGWVTGVNPFGYKKAIDTDAVMNWFKVAVGDEVDVGTLRYYTSKTKGLNAYRDKIKNFVATLDTDTIERYRQFIIDVQEQYTDTLQQSWVQALRTDYMDSASVVTAASILYLNNKTKLPTKLLGTYDDVLRGIRRDYIIDTSKLTEAMKYDEIIADLTKQGNFYDALDAAEYAFGINRIISTEKHIQNSALRRVLHYVDSFKSLFQDASKETQAELIKAQRDAFEQLCVDQTVHIASLAPDAMRIYMLSNKAPIMFFDTNTNSALRAAAKQLLDNEKAFAELGITVKQVDDEMFIYFNKSQHFDHFVDEDGFHAIFNGEQYTIDFATQNKLTLNDGIHDVEALRAVHDEIATITNGQSIGQLGNMLTKDQIEEYLSALPKVILDDINPAEFTKSTMFNGYLFDSMNLGTVASRRKYNQYLPTDYIKILANNASDIIHKANKKNLTLDYILNADMSVKAMVAQYGEEAVKKQLLQNDNYAVIQLVRSQKLSDKGVGFRGLGLKVKELNPKYADDWATMLSEDSGCIMVPRYMYSEIYEALNSSILYTNPVYKTLHGISYLTKLGQIGTVGKVFRDTIEGSLKTMIETGNILGTLKNTGLAMKNLNEYKKAVQNILKLSEIDYQKLADIGVDAAEFATKYINNQCEAFSLIQNYYSSLKDIMKMDTNKMFLETNKDFYFEQICKTMDKETFNTMHTLITESGTLGKLPAWSRYTADLHKEKQKRFINDFNKGLIGDVMIEGNKNIGEQIYDTFVNFGNLLLTPAQYLDQVNRVAQYLTFMDAGFVNPTAAIGKVSRTFFDATVKTESELIAELFIPFYAFFKHNTIYWAKAVDEHPYIARMFGDLLSELQDEDSIPHVTDYEEMHNQSLQNTMLAGNWVLNAIDTRRRELEGGAIDQDAVTLKLNFPFMEAYQMATRPISYMLNATNPAIQLALQSWIGNNPSVPTAVTSALDIYRPYNFDEGARGNLDYYSLIPFVGPTIQRWGPDGYAYKQYEKTGFLGNLVLPSVFGVLNRFPEYPELSAATKTITSSVRPKGLSSKQYQYLSRNGFNTQQRTTGTRRKIKGYSTGRTKQPYVKKHRYYTKKAFRTMYYPPRRKPDNTVYRRLFNSYGKTRIQQIGVPKMVKRSQYTLRNYFNYLR